MAAFTLPLKSLRKGGTAKDMFQFIRAYLDQVRAQLKREDEEGQTLVEYGLLLALIAIIVIVALLFLGPIVSQIFSNVATNLQGA
jgi:pilus assembly protein Flp/PilA